MNAVECRSVHFAYPQRTILRDFTLSLATDRVHAILGANGSGKSTLLSLLIGWIPPTRGTVLVSGNDPRRGSRSESARRVALLPQAETAAFAHSALEFALLGRAPYLSAGARPTHADIEIARTALRRAGVERYADQPVTKLSGGQWHQVLLARALTQQPQVLLLDEPSAYLDPAQTAGLVAIVRELVTQQVTVVIVSHDLAFVRSVADHCALLADGRCLASGKPTAVMRADLLHQVYGAPVSLD